MYSARKPYQRLGLSRTRFFSAPARHLMESGSEESVFEKPYQDQEYGDMHQSPNKPAVSQIDSGIGKGFNCYYSAQVCSEGIECFVGTSIPVTGGPYEAQAGFRKPIAQQGEIISYLIDGAAGRHIQINVDPRKVTHSISIEYVDSYGTSHYKSITLDCDSLLARGILWIPDYDADETVVVDVATRAVLQRISHTFSTDGPGGLASDGVYVWVANSWLNGLDKINMTTYAIDETITSGSDNPDEVLFDGTHIWVSDHVADHIQKIDITDGSLAATVDVGNTPNRMVFDGTHVWVANVIDQNVSKVSIATDTVVATVSVGAGGNDIAFDGTHVWVVNGIDFTISKISIATNTVVATIGVDDYPRGIAYDNNGFMWVTSMYGPTVSKINISTHAILEVVPGAVPLWITFDGTHMWVVNSGDDTFSLINVSTNEIDYTIDLNFDLALSGIYIA